MKQNKKGFTLIELLAVIVILAIIALIATPIILNMINDAKKSAAKDSAYGYIDAVEKYITLASMGKDINTAYDPKNLPVNYDNATGATCTIGSGSDCSALLSAVKIKGSAPESGSFTLKNGQVDSASLEFNGITVTYANGTASVS